MELNEGELNKRDENVYDSLRPVGKNVGKVPKTDKGVRSNLETMIFTWDIVMEGHIRKIAP